MNRIYELFICFVIALVFIYIQSLQKFLITVGLAVLIYIAYQFVKRLK